MNEGTEWIIPPSLLHNLERAPTDRPVAVLLRHSIRGPLPADDVGNSVPITPDGRRIALQLGQRLGVRIKTLHSSPIPRCIQTAQALRDGANVDLHISESRLLGDPGVYVIDGDLAWENWVRLGHEEVVRNLLSEDAALPGMAQPDEAARLLLDYMLSVAAERNGFHLFVTHDIVVAATVSRLQGTKYDSTGWPWFLEGALFWLSDNGVQIAYRETSLLS